MQPDLQNRSVIASEIRIVEVWHEALNAGDVDRLVALLHPDVARWVVVLAGPATAQLLREWLDRANIRLDPGASSTRRTRWLWSRRRI
jgi:ketosteroid isomerase-like protein